MAFSKSWYFFVTDQDDANKIPRGFKTLDKDVVEGTRSVQEVFYGFKCHKSGFAIFGYITFEDCMDEMMVSLVMPEFQIAKFPTLHKQRSAFHSYMKSQSIFTKLNVGGNGATPVIEVEQQWQYMELHEII